MPQLAALSSSLGRRLRGGRGRLVPGVALTGLLVLALLALVGVYPVLRLGQTALQRLDGAWTLEYLGEVVSAPGLADAVVNSLVVAVVVTVGATLLGSVLAWLVARTDVWGRRKLRWALLTPFVIPPFVGAISWLHLFGSAGWFNQLARAAGLTDGTLWNVRGFDGIVFVLILTSYPLAYITVLGALNRLDPSMEEGARVSGAGLLRILRDVTIPVMRPAIASGAVLVFIYAMANFGVPAVLGFTENYYVLTTRIYDLIAQSARPGSLNQAAALSMLLGAIALVALTLQGIGARRTESRLGQRSTPDVPLRLGRRKAMPSLLAWATVAVAGVLPVGAIVLGGLTDVLGRPPLPGNLTVENFVRAVVASPATLRAIRNSFTLALLAGLIVAVLGAVIGYLVRRTRLPGRSALDGLATFPYALPGTVVAAAVLLGFIRPLAGVALFNTLWIILVAYLAHYLAYGVRTTSGALALMDTSLEEASRACGASRVTTFWRIVVPMLRPALFGGFFLVFIPTMRELTISVLLWSPGNETLGVVVFSLQEAGETQAAAAVAMLMIATVGLMNVITRRLSGGRLGY
ncbi:MAG: ABC transporter permease [Nitriliruptorales bacterium]